MRRVPAFLLLTVCVDSLCALDRSLSPAQYLHTSWTQEEGSALPAIQALAQTSDGYLWLGTGKGLFRFDGVRFVASEPGSGERLPDSDVRCLRPASQGGLWIGTRFGVCRLDKGRIIRYPEADRLLGGGVFAMLEDPMGRLWIISARDANTSLAMLLPGGAVRVYGLADGLPEHKLQILFEDRGGHLWLGTNKGLCRWSPGSQAVCLSVPPLDVAAVVEDERGEFLIADRGTKTVLRSSHGKLKPVLTALQNASPAPRHVMRDRDGNVWIGTYGQGLVRLREGRLERFTRRDGLSSDLVRALLEDREGNLWVGTARGIDRFRDPGVLHLSTLDGLSSDIITSVCATHQGAAWVGTAGGGLNRIQGGRVTQYLMNSGLPSTTVYSLYADPRGRLWAGTTAGLARRSGDRFIEVRTPDGAHLDQVFAMAGDRSGAMWLADGQKGLFAIRNGDARAVVVPGLENHDIYQLQLGRSGVLWIGHYQGGISAIRGNSTEVFDSPDGVAGGPVQAIYEDRHGTVWVGAGGGLSRFRDGRWTTWTNRHGLPDGGVQGIIEDDHDTLWLMTGSGLLRLAVAQLNETPDGSPRSLNFNLYGRSDGLRLSNTGNMANPRMTKSGDGRLWISTEDGVAVVDPLRLHSNPFAPPVVIEQMVVDGKALDTNSAPEAAFRGRELQIAYTGLSLMAPESVHFRYRLDGLDRMWTDAGTRRNVVYVNLPPGRYRFRVIACNSDGVWNLTGAGLSFRVAPYFYQTTWFLALCLAVAALLAWGVHWLRIRSIVSRVQLVAQERARVMRELHDSLLQGFAGVVYQLEAAARQFESHPEVSKQRLERALDQADESLHEARRTIMSMRLPALENSTLPEALSETGKHLTEGTPAAFRLNVKGPILQLPYEVQANLYLIAREAITNSVNHSGARRISAQLTSSADEIRLIVQDDGSGFDPEAGRAKKDHWGMRGMQERAAQMGAAFAIDSAPGQGTTVAVTVPCKK